MHTARMSLDTAAMPETRPPRRRPAHPGSESTDDDPQAITAATTTAASSGAPTMVPTRPDGKVTIVVATRDRRADLEHSLAHHDAPVIVVDNGSTDGSVDAVRARDPAIDVVALSENRGAPARNIGVERARTPYVAFADDDSWWAPGSLARAADLFDIHPRLALLACGTRSRSAWAPGTWP
jgi:cellulose synthase/poly-beta-1,6-N-acetylglucosamine synthase-like glycosyltransferase